MKHKSYITPLDLDGDIYQIETSIWQEKMPKLRKLTKYPGRVLLTYIQYKTDCPKNAMASRTTIWRHKKIWAKAGIL